MLQLSPESPRELVERDLLCLGKEQWWRVIRNRRVSIPFVAMPRFMMELVTTRRWPIFSIAEIITFVYLFG